MVAETNNTEALEPIKTIEDKDTPLSEIVQAKKRGRGRPPKSDLTAARDSRKGKVGRPKGDNHRMQEFKERLLVTGGKRILDKMVSIALDDKHPGQMAAIKLAIDRILPTSVFDTSKGGGGIPQISINISSMGTPSIIGTTSDMDTLEDLSNYDSLDDSDERDTRINE